MSRSLKALTTYPPVGTARSSPSSSSRTNAVLIGVRETPRRCTKASSDIRSPALTSPFKMSSRSRKSAVTVCDDVRSDAGSIVSSPCDVFQLYTIAPPPGEAHLKFCRRRQFLTPHAPACPAHPCSSFIRKILKNQWQFGPMTDCRVKSGNDQIGERYLVRLVLCADSGRPKCQSALPSQRIVCNGCHVRFRRRPRVCKRRVSSGGPRETKFRSYSDHPCRQPASACGSHAGDVGLWS